MKCSEFLAHLISAIVTDAFLASTFSFSFIELHTFCKVNFMCCGYRHPCILFALQLLLKTLYGTGNSNRGSEST